MNLPAGRQRLNAQNFIETPNGHKVVGRLLWQSLRRLSAHTLKNQLGKLLIGVNNAMIVALLIAMLEGMDERAGLIVNRFGGRLHL